MRPGFTIDYNANARAAGVGGWAWLICNQSKSMTDFSDLVVPATVCTKLSISGKKQLFQKLAELAANAYSLDAGEVYDRLLERERLGSTGFGGGVAIPHAKIDGLDQVYGIALRLDEPIAFEAVDDAPVDVVFSLLSPADSGAEHLKTLARVSRYLRNEQNIARIRGVGSDAALLALLTGEEARDAA
jgi:nitrogen PTS system EIIA component